MEEAPEKEEYQGEEEDEDGQVVQEQEVDLGPVIGKVLLLQRSEKSYHRGCLLGDSTGERLCTAGHLLSRFICSHTELFKNKRVCEIGCGVGVNSIVACRVTDLSEIVLSDGNAETTAIAQKNIEAAGLLESNRAKVQTYRWGDPLPSSLTNPFDILLGSELTYYNTDMALLVRTAKTLVCPDGLFLHAHIFRKQGQEEEMISCFTQIGWETLEVPISTIVSEEELKNYGSWYSVRCLVSGSRAKIALLSKLFPKFSEFQPEKLIDDSDDDNDSDNGLGSLFS